MAKLGLAYFWAFWHNPFVVSNRLKEEECPVTQHRVVVTVTDGPESWPFLLNSLGNLLAAYPEGSLTVELVAYGPKGISLLRKGSSGADRLTELNGRGLRCLACGNTLKNQQISQEDLLAFVEVVPAGIAHLIEREEEGWSYVKGGF